MKYCDPIVRHFITKTSGNAAVALSMAKEVWVKENAPSDVHDLVKLIDEASRKLIKACERHAAAATS